MQSENVLVALIQPFGGFCLGNPLLNVLHNPRAFFDFLSCEQSFSCNARCANPDTNFHPILLHEEGQSPEAAVFIRRRVATCAAREEYSIIRHAVLHAKVTDTWEMVHEP